MRSPKQFVGLHCHTGRSAFDGLGPPEAHIDFVRENGMNAWALTDHGHLNGFATAYLYTQKLRSRGIDFKFIPGVECYIHPSLEEWAKIKAEHDALPPEKKAKKRVVFPDDGIDQDPDSENNKYADDAEHSTNNALTVENEDDTRTGKAFNPLNRRHHLVVLPKTPAALKKIFKLVSRGYLEGFYRFPRIDLRMLKEASNGEDDIIVSTACIGGPLAYAILEQLRDTTWDTLNPVMLDDQTLLDRCVAAVRETYAQYVAVVGAKNVYIELQFNRIPAQDVINRVLLAFAEYDCLTDQLIVTADSHYPRPELWYHREMYKKLGYLNYAEYGPESLPKSRDDLKCELYPKNASQIWEEYLKSRVRCVFYQHDKIDELVCDAIERTYDIAHNVIGDIVLDRSFKFPVKLVPEGKTPIKHLIEMCKKGLVKRGLDSKPEYVERLITELGVIKKMNFAPYFITLERVMKLARNVCLCGVARGSGGGSLVAYCLEITDLDPIKYECRFDRFLNVNREGAPDIDVDVADRDAVLDILRREFGTDNVLPISNYNTFKVKTLVKDISKFYGIPFDEVNAATKTVENDVRKAVMKHGDDKNLFVLKFDDALQHSKPFKEFIDKHSQIAETINILFKEQRSLGRHAGGVVIMDDAPNMMPLITSGGEPQTPWVEGVEVKTLEPLGYIKYDLLGLETMRLIQRTIELILQRHAGIKKPMFAQIRDWYEKHLHPDANDYDDQKVYDHVYAQGNFAGIFQLTSQGAQRLFKTARPTSIVDIAVLTSIYRPGPLAAKVDKLYVDARKGKKYDWGHPIFETVLGKTDNLLIFQESVMDLAELVGGFPKDQCDKVRKAIMKRSISGGEEAKKKAKEMEDAFVKGAVTKGVSEVIAHEAYQKILWFAGYGFNRAHAMAYAIDSYMCAWLLTYYQDEWLCAYLESMSNNPDDKAKAFGEIKALGYEIVPIDINHAGSAWTILSGKKFMPSLLSCKGVGESAIEEIVENRPYNTIEDVLWNEDGSWKHSKFNKRALESLIKIGAFGSLDCVGEDKLFKNYRVMHEVIIENADVIKKNPKRDPGAGRRSFYELARKFNEENLEWSRREQAQNRIDVFGSLDASTLMAPQVIELFAKHNVRAIDAHEGETGIYWFCVQKSTLKLTKNNRRYLMVEAVGNSGKRVRMNVWSWDGPPLDDYSVCYAEVSKNDYGFATSMRKIKVL